MNKIFVIFKREYLTKVKKKTFILMTILVPLIMGALMLLPILFQKISTGKEVIAVLDVSGMYNKKISDTGSIYFSYLNGDLEELKDSYKSKGFSGILFIPNIDINRPLGITYYSDKQLGMSAVMHIRRELEKTIEDFRFAEEGLDRDYIEKLRVDLDIDTIVLSEEGEKSGNMMVSIIFSQIMGFILYFTLFMYGTMTMKSVVEEKRNRIVEVIISSVKPFQLMLGKIFGIAAVALTQLIIWVLLFSLIGFVIFTAFLPDLMNIEKGLNQAELQQAYELTSYETIAYDIMSLDFRKIIAIFAFYFIFGYLLYSAMFAAIGSIAGDEPENQSLTMIVALPVIISLFIMTNVVEQPHSPLAFWSSLFPLFSPIVMVARSHFDVPGWQMTLSMVLLAATFVVVTWLAGKIYRTGILLYGKKITVKEITRWLFIKE